MTRALVIVAWIFVLALGFTLLVGAEKPEPPGVRLYFQSRGDYEMPEWGGWVRKAMGDLRVREYADAEPGDFELHVEVQAWRLPYTGRCDLAVTWTLYRCHLDGKLDAGDTATESLRAECVTLLKMIRPYMTERAQGIAGVIRKAKPLRPSGD